MRKHGHRISQEVIHVTNFQKAFCIVLSLCFFASLAILPGALFTGENVYRHLPLYRFLEKKTQVSSYEDRETYEKIAGENGKYLGECARSEQLVAENEKTTPEPEENAVTEETIVPEETAMPEKTAIPEETIIPEETATPEETLAPEKTATPE